MTHYSTDFVPSPTTQALTGQALPVLQLLADGQAVLAVAADMEKAVVVADTAEAARPERRMVVDRALAEAMAQQGWIACAQPGRVSRYHITAGGTRVLVGQGAGAPGFREATAAFQPATPITPVAPAAPAARAGEAEGDARYRSGETPLALLARRRDKSGQLFLQPEMVRAGERLKEDYELTQLNPVGQPDWAAYLARGDGALPAAQPSGPVIRVARALSDLGPGLGDVCLRCCCYLEGLETAERRLGWSARSGKIVLRIALQRLQQHYRDLGEDAGLIG